MEIVRVDGPRKQGDLHVRFLDGDEAGLQEWVARGQLVVPWADVEAFLDDDRRWAAAFEESREARGSVEFEVAKLVLREVRPKNRIRLRHAVADAGVIEIADLDTVASWLGLDPEGLRGQPLAFEGKFGTLCGGVADDPSSGHESGGSPRARHLEEDGETGGGTQGPAL
ncbi:hypothetical protein [Actinoallomurus sp. NPDC052274]|uniref:hypothetical protein n=1 Tax=Actinoallomurus sp. NPDC052274 TaxID=3155420 RepID=UPI003432990C